MTREYHGAGTTAANILLWLWTRRYDYRSAYPYALVGPRGLLPPVRRPDLPVWKSQDWTDHAHCTLDYGGGILKGWPELIPLRCRTIKRAGLAWGLRCFLDKDHEGPCHF